MHVGERAGVVLLSALLTQVTLGCGGKSTESVRAASDDSATSKGDEDTGDEDPGEGAAPSGNGSEGTQTCVWGVDELLVEVGAGSSDREDCGSTNSAFTERVLELYECFEGRRDMGSQFTVNYCVDCAIPSTFVAMPDGQTYRIELEEDVFGDSQREATVERCADVVYGEGRVTCEGAEELYHCAEPLGRK